MTFAVDWAFNNNYLSVTLTARVSKQSTTTSTGYVCTSLIFRTTPDIVPGKKTEEERTRKCYPTISTRFGTKTLLAGRQTGRRRTGTGGHGSESRADS